MDATSRRPYKVCSSDRRKNIGIVAASLEELKEKAGSKLDISSARFRVFLETDGTEVDDEEYFAFLEDQTKFMIVFDGEDWSPGSQYDSLQSQGSVGSFNASLERNESIEFDGTDAGETEDSIPTDLLHKIKNDPTFFISFSEKNLENVINFDCDQFATALGKSVAEAEYSQETCQRELDRRREFKEATQLLKMLEGVQKNETLVGNKRPRPTSEQ